MNQRMMFKATLLITLLLKNVSFKLLSQNEKEVIQRLWEILEPYTGV